MNPIALQARPTLRYMDMAPWGSPFDMVVETGEAWRFHLHFTELECRYGGQTYAVRPGSATLYPPHRTFTVAGHGSADHLWYSAHFTLPAGAAKFAVPLILELGDEFGDFEKALRHAVGCRASNPARAEAAVWELLWRVEERAALKSTEGEPRRHPALEQAVRLIEQRLQEPLSVAALASEVGLSHNHLTRLFQSAFGQTVVAYIRGRRGERARYLLTQTRLPLKLIAAQIGIHDPHLFNKTVRRTLGASPLAIRGGG